MLSERSKSKYTIICLPFREYHATMKSSALLVCVVIALVAYAIVTFRSPQYVDTQVQDLKDEYDFIVVGAGSAGCVLAARLSENPNVSVLLLESGGHDDLSEVKIPLAASQLPNTRLNWRYMADTDAGSRVGYYKYGGQTHWIAGKGLGGTSSLNWMMYTRGNAEDYDSWARGGAKGWTYDEVLPYFKKAESYMGSIAVDDAYHGHDGPIVVTNADPILPALAAVLDASEEAGYGVNKDYNGKTQFGFARSQFTIKNGQRWSTADGYLRPAWKRPNLHVMTDAHVTRVVTKDKTAIGVEFYPPSSVQAKRVTAAKEIILSAGAVGSPKILLLSGIGPKDELAKHNIPIVTELDVGQHLQDHVLTSIPFLLNGHHGYTVEEAQSLRTLASYLIWGSGALSTSALDVTGFVRTKYAVAENWTRPDIQYYVMCVGGDEDIGSIMANIRKEFAEFVFRSVGTERKNRKAINSCVFLPNVLHPESRGVLQLRSSDPFVAPIIRPKYHSSRRDIAVLREGAKIALELLATKSLGKLLNDTHGLAMYNEMKARSCLGLAHDSDECLEKTLEEASSTGWHYTSTCKMGPAADSTAVVDEQLLVHGIQRLRVVDASVMPTLPSGNTNAPTIMIGEKAADLIKQHWNL